MVGSGVARDEQRDDERLEPLRVFEHQSAPVIGITEMDEESTGY